MKQICKACGLEKELIEYYKHPQGKNGVLSRCKECIKKGRRGKKEREMARIWESKKRVRPKGYQSKRIKQYRIDNPIKYNAHKKVNNYLRSHKNDYKFKCVICGKDNKIELHHDDYEKPNQIIPFCSLHHKRYHCGDFDIQEEWIIKIPF